MGYLYGRYVDGPDPLAPPIDLRAALMEGSSAQQALRELLRQGMPGRRGLDELTREIRKRRRDLQRENRLDGTLQEIRELLAKALEAERDSLMRQDSDDARFREMQLDMLPDDTGGAVRELGSYDWQSAEGAAAGSAGPTMMSSAWTMVRASWSRTTSGMLSARAAMRLQMASCAGVWPSSAYHPASTRIAAGSSSPPVSRSSTASERAPSARRT